MVILLRFSRVAAGGPRICIQLTFYSTTVIQVTGTGRTLTHFRVLMELLLRLPALTRIRRMLLRPLWLMLTSGRLLLFGQVTLRARR